MIFFESLENKKIEDLKPEPDIAICVECNKKFKLSECLIDTDGDWETGYYTILLCPKCPGGGEIEYIYSFFQLLKYKLWERKHP